MPIQLGFFSFQYGADGLERYYNDQLAGQKETQQFNSLKDIFTVTDTSADLTITLNHSVNKRQKKLWGNETDLSLWSIQEQELFLHFGVTRPMTQVSLVLQI